MPDILPPAPAEEPDPLVVPQERRRPNIFALAATAIGFGLAIAGQYLPWGVYGLNTSARLTLDEDPSAVARNLEVPLAYMGAGHVTAYLFTLALSLAGLGVVLSVPGDVRRIATGFTAGLLGANLLVLVGFTTAIDHLGASDPSLLLVENTNAKWGPGYLLAYAAVLILAAALVLAARPLLGGDSWVPRPRRGADAAGTAEPLELTVTPVPPKFQ